MKFIELFAGIGGFRVGLEKIKGFEHVWSNEWDKYSASIYRRHYGEIDTRDIRGIESRQIPDHDLLTAGFPCQAFSIAGKGRGFEDTRGTLFFEIVRILRDKRPRHFLLENVKGLVGHKSGQTFQTILKILSDLGYRVEWEVLNSKYFGVPQNRERVFIVGHLGGGSGRKIFPLRQTSEVFDERYAEIQIASTLQSPGHACGNYRGMNMIQVGNIDQQGHNSLWGRVYHPSGLSATINAHGGGMGAKTGLYAVVIGDGKVSVRQTVNCLDANYWKGLNGHQQRTGIMKPHVKNSRIRRLIPLECERLQGFEDNWTAGVSDTRRYMALGNAVTTNVITAIGKKLIRP